MQSVFVLNCQVGCSKNRWAKCDRKFTRSKPWNVNHFEPSHSDCELFFNRSNIIAIPKPNISGEVKAKVSPHPTFDIRSVGLSFRKCFAHNRCRNTLMVLALALCTQCLLWKQNECHFYLSKSPAKCENDVFENLNALTRCQVKKIAR